MRHTVPEISRRIDAHCASALGIAEPSIEQDLAGAYTKLNRRPAVRRASSTALAPWPSCTPLDATPAPGARASEGSGCTRNCTRYFSSQSTAARVDLHSASLLARAMRRARSSLQDESIAGYALGRVKLR